MPTAQQGMGADPGAENPEAGESKNRPRNMAETPEEEVRKVLTQQYRRQQNRGALGVDAGIDAITEGAQKEIDDRVKEIRSMGGDASKLSSAGDAALKEYERERALMKMTDKGYIVADLRREGAAGKYETGLDRITIDSSVALSPDVQYKDIMYARHVCKHEEWHQKEQAKIFNATKIKAGGRSFPIHPDLIEGQAVVKVSKENDQDDRQTAKYLQYAESYRLAAKFVGEERLDEAIKKGDLKTLQEKIDAEEAAGNRKAA